MEQRQFERKGLPRGADLQVSLFLNARSLIHQGRSEKFELGAKPVDISAGGIGLRLQFKADLLTLQPGKEILVRLIGSKRDETVNAKIAHFDEKEGFLGLAFRPALSHTSF